jgi:PAS domain S-box-containing protein
MVDVAARAPVPVVVLDLPTKRIVAVSDALLDMVGTSRADLVGTKASRFLVDKPTPALPLLTTGQIEGYELTRRLRFPDARTVVVHIWAHALGDERPPRAALLVIDEEGTPVPTDWAPTAAGSMVIGTVDTEWRIDRVSSDIESFLGWTPELVLGRSVLRGIHHGDLAELLGGLGHAERSQRAVIVRLRLRAIDGEWCWCRACLSPLADSAGFAFLLSPVRGQTESPDLALQLQERLSRIAHEVRAASTLPSVHTLPAANDMPGLSTLTGREWQVLGALRGGSRGAEIARSLHLAPSTVRNHLAAIYRKLGVRSQVSLLAALNARDRLA